MAEMSGAEMIGVGELSRTRNIHLPKHGCELPREESRSRPARPLLYTAKGWSRCRDNTYPDVPLPVHSVPESSVAALASDPWSQCSVTTSSFGCFPKMALSKPCSLSGRWQRAGPFGSKRLRAAKCLPLWIVPKYEQPWSDCCSSEMVSWNQHTQRGLLAHGHSGMTCKVSFQARKAKNVGGGSWPWIQFLKLVCHLCWCVGASSHLREGCGFIGKVS